MRLSGADGQRLFSPGGHGLQVIVGPFHGPGVIQVGLPGLQPFSDTPLHLAARRQFPIPVQAIRAVIFRIIAETRDFQGDATRMAITVEHAVLLPLNRYA
jgi:hypothetical protein